MSADPLAQIEAARAKLLHLAGERATVERALVPLSEAKARLAEAVASAAARWVPAVSGFARHGDRPPIRLAQALAQTPESLLAALAGDAILARGEAALQTAYSANPLTLDATTRAAKLTEIAVATDHFEREEERLIREAEGAGLDVQRRRDAREDLVLCPDIELVA
jgi:hypothetical protein